MKYILIRMLSDIPVVSYVFELDNEDCELDLQDDYAIDIAKGHIEDFTNKFCEFKNAKFFLQCYSSINSSATIIYTR